MSKVLKSTIKNRPDLGQDELYYVPDNRKIISVICNCKSVIVEERGTGYNYINYTKGRSYDVQK